MTRTLQDILDDIDDKDAMAFLTETLPNVSLHSFSYSKTLFDFQQDALKNSIKALFLFYERHNQDKNSFFSVYLNNEVSLQNYKASSYFDEYEEYFPKDPKGEYIPFSNFCNRISFWMATGSGKTLVIIKLIEILSALMKSRKLPKRDILFLAHRQEIIEQFKDLVDEFNQLSDYKIALHNLKDFNRVKYDNPSILADSIDVFFYRSDLISDESKQSIIDFRSYDNEGKWFILLDEAHKGTQKDISKRQAFYSILSRDAFLFNFSATFTEINDNATCAFNFNLDKFVNAGYGKQIYVSEKNAKGFDKKTDFSDRDKQKVVLKSLILHTYISEYIAKIRDSSGDKGIYHRPLLMGLVNSVNFKGADDLKKRAPDLLLLFEELDKISNKKLINGLFEDARKELADEMEGAIYSVGKDRVQIDKKFLLGITYQNLLKAVFNSTKSGNIEVLSIPGNRQEIAFKLHTAEKPFALIRIGDTSGWHKNILYGNKEISETQQEKSWFGSLNYPDSSINILMGSRTFYEGWDSNRPNIILFVNIGKGVDSKKFVLQSIGRGVRIEPILNKRRRMQRLLNSNKVKEGLYKKVQAYIHAPESLFIFGTNAENLSNIIDYVKQEKGESQNRPRPLGDLFEGSAPNSIPIDKTQLLVPKYIPVDSLVPKDDLPLYPISTEDLALSQEFLTNINDKVAMLMYKCSSKVLDRVKETFKDTDQSYDTDIGTPDLNRPFLSADRIIKYFSQTTKEFDKFKPLEGEIKHHTEITFVGADDLYEELKEKIKFMAKFPEHNAELRKKYQDNRGDGKNSGFDDFSKAAAKLENAQRIKINDVTINIEYLANHYYNPILVSEKEKQDYLKNIIQVPSEVDFLNKLSDMAGELDQAFEWWMFSKINEKWDKLGIPYYNTDISRTTTYHPDFIFWLKEKNSKMLHIVFVDPKGTKISDYQHQAAWYSRVFGKPGEEKIHTNEGLEVKLYLKFFTNDKSHVPELIRKYWIESPKEIADIGKNQAKK